MSFNHHESHAAAGYYTAPFDDCNIIVVDAIGEWDTVSIWDNMKKVKSWKYPYSLGLLYSAITQRIGLKPNEDEYITMGMAAFGQPTYDLEPLLWQNNHRGVGNVWKDAWKVDLAASVQALYEKKLLELVDMCPKENIILMGGCAANCVANSKIQKEYLDNAVAGRCGFCIRCCCTSKQKESYSGKVHILELILTVQYGFVVLFKNF